MALTGDESGRIFVWDVEEGSVQHVVQHMDPTDTTTMAKDGKLKSRGDGKTNKNVVSAVTFCRARREWASAGQDGWSLYLLCGDEKLCADDCFFPRFRRRLGK